MATSQGDILRWLKEGKSQGATHLLVVCDTFAHEDYPVYVKPGEDVRECARVYDGANMQRLMEVYALHLDWKQQLGEFRSFHYESPPRTTPASKKLAAPKKPTKKPSKKPAAKKKATKKPITKKTKPRTSGR
jgi:hypothetical protein